jgi:hypothetical protein
VNDHAQDSNVVKQIDKDVGLEPAPHPYAKIISHLDSLPVERQLEYYLPKAKSLSVAAKYDNDRDSLYVFVRDLAYYKKYEVLDRLERESDITGKQVCWVCLSNAAEGDTRAVDTLIDLCIVS